MLTNVFEEMLIIFVKEIPLRIFEEIHIKIFAKMLIQIWCQLSSQAVVPKLNVHLIDRP